VRRVYNVIGKDKVEEDENGKKYFLPSEYWETITKKLYNRNEAMVEKSYVYKVSGAKYTGQWKGGFRHGSGTMVWPDGASYQG